MRVILVFLDLYFRRTLDVKLDFETHNNDFSVSNASRILQQ